MSSKTTTIVTLISLALSIAVSIVTIIYVKNTKSCTTANTKQGQFLSIMAWIELGLVGLAILTGIIRSGNTMK